MTNPSAWGPLARQVLLLAGLVLAAEAVPGEEPHVVRLRGDDRGRVFEGIGALSAGASSRLLVDYPEPQRGQILDYLFEPRYGASFHHLKVEIGGDVNSTCGTEPSFAHTREELDHPRPEYFRRGYEYWLMAEARRRNPVIALGALQWGAPFWVGDGEFYSQDNADLVAAFHRGAREHWGVKTDFTGIWNETDTDFEWIETLRATLDRAGLEDVKVVVGDDLSDPWEIVDRMAERPALAAAVHAIGAHYASYRSPGKAQESGKPLWATEDGPWRGDWYGAAKLARLYNRNYIEGRYTRTIVWSLVTSYFDILPLPGSGVMRANEPWSGAYEIQPALWVTAHTTQFAEPGWTYLDGGCGYLPGGGSHVALRSPDGRGDYTVVVETMGSPYVYPYWGAQNVVFEIGEGLSDAPVHVWKTNHLEHFVLAETIQPRDRRFEVTFQGESVYSLTTTTGQRKGDAGGAEPAPFPRPFSDDFEAYEPFQAPRYFSDQAGVFEVADRADGQGRCLRQVVPARGIEWRLHLNPFPETIVGDARWKDYAVSVRARLEGEGFVSVFGRVGRVPQSEEPPDGYWLRVDHEGRWALLAASEVIASGVGAPPGADWHELELAFEGNALRALLDGLLLTEVRDDSFSRGMAGLGSGWNHACFDDFAVR